MVMNRSDRFLSKLGSLIVLPTLFLLFSACANHHEQASVNRVPASHSLSASTQPDEEVKPSGSEVEKGSPREEAGKTVVLSKASDSKVQVTQKSTMKEPEISLDDLVERLKKTEAIGVFTKLAIRSDVLDFKESIDTYRKNGELEKYIGHLRDHFDGLLLKILALLERDPPLSRDIQHARESIWRSFLEAKS